MEELNKRKQWQSMVSSHNPELLKKAQEEVNENLERRDDDIQKIRNMVLAEEKLTCPTDDAFLLRFLRSFRFDHEKAFKLLKQYYTFKMKHPEVFIDYRPSANMPTLNEMVVAIMPERDQEGRRIYVLSIGRWDPSATKSDSVIRLIHMCVDHVLEEEETQVNGIVVILNMKNVKWEHVSPFLSNRSARRIAILLETCLPVRFKGFHVVFEPSIFQMAFCIIKPFLNEETKSKIFIHGKNLASLHKHVQPDFLPEEFGGLLPPINNSSMVQSLLAKDDEIASNVAKYGYLNVP